MDMFSALAEPTRRLIFELLASQGRLPVSAIAEHFPISTPAVSQHLKVLREARLVRMEKRAQQRIYEVDPEAMAALEGWVRQLRGRLDEQFEALDQVLAAEQQKTLANSATGSQPAGDLQEGHDG